jgi:hypothetical protein
MNLKVKMSTKAFTDLFRYLEKHEIDIANDVHDFGGLKRMFIEFFGRSPNKETPDE